MIKVFYILNTEILSNNFRGKKYHRMYDPHSELPIFKEYLRKKLGTSKDNILYRHLKVDFIY